jgi:hypothetical protein
MYLQAALLKASRDALQHLSRPLLCFAVRHNIICVSLKRHIWLRLAHPDVECKMQEDIGQKRANDSALRRPLLSQHKRTIFVLHRDFEPPLNVEQYPSTLCVLAHRAQNQPMVKVVKEPSNVEVNHPVLAPAPLARCRYRIMCRLFHSISIGVVVKIRLYQRLQIFLDNRLRNPIRHGRYAQRSHTSIFLQFTDRTAGGK